ncbi:hypothetical protein A2U01_0115638, partial [Trifolium medium]|nr:hypothetical protein [Trifolium medium]
MCTRMAELRIQPRAGDGGSQISAIDLCLLAVRW